MTTVKADGSKGTSFRADVVYYDNGTVSIIEVKTTKRTNYDPKLSPGQDAAIDHIQNGSGMFKLTPASMEKLNIDKTQGHQPYIKVDRMTKSIKTY